MRTLRALLLAAALLCAGCQVDVGATTDPELAGVAEELDAFWQEALPELEDVPDLVLAEGDQDTACGAAAEDEGSFYCSADTTVYVQQLDLDDLAGQGPAAVEAGRTYLVSHEYGHAVQDLLGLEQGEAGKGPDGPSVRYELQADCLSGAFVGSRDDVAREPYLAAVRDSGDDTGPEPLPEAEYEHGSSAQRVAAFLRGLDDGVQACGLAG